MRTIELILVMLRLFKKSRKRIENGDNSPTRSASSSSPAAVPWRQFSLPEITPILPRADGLRPKVRFNLLVPSLRKEHRFGGINTALSFFNKLVDEQVEARIVVTDAAVAPEDIADFPAYRLTTSAESPAYPRQIVPFNDRYQATLPVSPNDIFIATAWWTAYGAIELIQWQTRSQMTEGRHLVYFIQDFEPGFYSWSEHYDFALSTYSSRVPTIAIFNTTLLRDYFHRQGLRFAKEYAFEPRLNAELRSKLTGAQMSRKERIILLYGRPNTPRNGFRTIIHALGVWRARYAHASRWTIISLGEPHAPIDLDGLTVISQGKATLPEYADLLVRAAIGVSIMISPHPSYPPLEMAHFGCLTITNDFANKQLAGVHENFRTMPFTTPDAIAEELVAACDNFEADSGIGGRARSFLHDYTSESTPFDFAEHLRTQLLRTCMAVDFKSS